MPGDVHDGVLFVTEQGPGRVDGAGYDIDTLDPDYQPTNMDIARVNLYAVKLDTQETIWTARAFGNIRHAPVYSDGLVYVGTNEGWLSAFNSLDGVEVWKYKRAPGVGYGWQSPVVVGDAIIAVESGTGASVIARNKKTGAEVWTFDGMEKGSYTTPVYGGGSVYFGSVDNRFYAVNVETGVKVWDYTPQDPGDLRSAPAYNNGVVYFVAKKKYVIALNSATGDLIWETDLGPGK